MEKKLFADGRLDDIQISFKDIYLAKKKNFYFGFADLERGWLR